MAGGKRRGRSDRKKKPIDNLSKRQKKHIQDYGELHPSDVSDKVKKYTTVKYAHESPATEVCQDGVDSGSDSDTESSAYQQLLSSFGDGERVTRYADDTDDEEDDEEEDVDENNDDVIDFDDTSKTCIAATKNGNTEIESEDYENADEEDDKLVEDDQQDEEEDDEEDVSELETQEHSLKESDPFSQHFEVDLPEEVGDKLGELTWNKQQIKMAHIGTGTFSYLHKDHHTPLNTSLPQTELKKLHIKHKLCDNVKLTNPACPDHSASSDSDPLSPFQQRMFDIMNNYHDVYFPNRTPENGEEIRLTYCLHALNHVLKTRSRVIAHNTKIKLKNTDEDHRDQGLTRPKVLIVLPFRESALRVINMFISLLMSTDQSAVSNKKRFMDEFSEVKDETTDEKKGRKPEDYETMFRGNTDDHFRIGLGVAKKTLKLYTDFYSSDIILSSPLGLRTIIGAEGEKRDYDFLSSIELLILDQADVFLMQNWDHILHLMKHMHVQPRESHGVDFSRVRMWTLNGWSKYYRQTMMFSSIVTPELNSLFNKHCCNYAGKLTFSRPPCAGSICGIVVQLPHVFHKLECSKYSELPDARFNFFVKHLLPQHNDMIMAQTLVFIPSYFDYVRVRNHFKKEDLPFVAVCEYSSDKVISRSRNYFYHKMTHFMLYTERIYFYRRLHIRGIRHLIFYDLPHYSRFYSEISNMLHDIKRDDTHTDFTCTAMYSKYDAQKLAEVVGTDRASHMLASSKNVHMFMTGNTPG